MGLSELLTGQFIFSLRPNNRTTLYVRLPEKNMIITIPFLIAAGIATAVVTGGITGPQCTSRRATQTSSQGIK
jgi:hypothetical protein